ncbi:phytanoyl-CoA dioxygenase family protein [Sorangium sp. So ce1389]|uniref:phytanoyl-CoA dioxygenase family protein n=1 Tax=Sorangium sp. So ce1389 TaxID=3133336 RepID=UPI003F60C934
MLGAMEEAAHRRDAAFEEALAALGAGPAALSAGEGRALDDAGYVLFRSVVEPAWIEALRADCDGWGAGGDGDSAQGGNQQLARLGEHQGAVLRALRWPRLLAAAWHVLRRPFALGAVAWRCPRPGLGQQGLHMDWGDQGDPGVFHVVTALWYLDEVTPDNGATRLVPGSHKLRRRPPKDLADPARHHPHEVTVEAEAGSVLVFNGHLWHSGTRNRSGAPRRALQCGFVAREHRGVSMTAVDETETMPPAARHVLGLMG